MVLSGVPRHWRFPPASGGHPPAGFYPLRGLLTGAWGRRRRRHFWPCRTRVGFGPATGPTIKAASCHIPKLVGCMINIRTWMVLEMRGRWPYSCCFVGCCFQDLFKSLEVMYLCSNKWQLLKLCSHTVVLTQPQGVDFRWKSFDIFSIYLVISTEFTFYRSLWNRFRNTWNTKKTFCMN